MTIQSIGLSPFKNQEMFEKLQAELDSQGITDIKDGKFIEA
jgi:hypothetical protein